MTFLAMTALTSGWTAAFYGLALALFLLATFLAWPIARPSPRSAYWPSAIAFGLAAWMFVLFWDALAFATR